MAAPGPSTTHPPLILECLEPPSEDPNVTTIDDGPTPTTRDLTRQAAHHDRMMDDRMDALLRGMDGDMRELENDMREMETARPRTPADLSRQDPAAPAEAPAPISASVELEELRPCSGCHRRCPPTDFVGVTGQRTTSTCNACCVCIPRIPSTFMPADSP